MMLQPPSSLAISLPFRIDATGTFAVSVTEEQRIRDLVISAIGTYYGERVMRVTFGSDVLRYNFERFGTTDDPSDDLEGSVRTALQKWVPDVTLEDVVVAAENSEDGRYSIRVVYRLGADTEVASFDINPL